MMRKMLVVLFSMFCVVSLAPNVSAADGNCEGSFWGMRPWYYGLVENDGKCTMKTPGEGAGQVSLTVYIWTIVLNIMHDFVILSGIFVMGYLAYGAFLYFTTDGEVGKMQAASRVLTNALIGLIIVIIAGAIVNSVMAVLINSSNRDNGSAGLVLDNVGKEII